MKLLESGDTGGKEKGLRAEEFPACCGVSIYFFYTLCRILKVYLCHNSEAQTYFTVTKCTMYFSTKLLDLAFRRQICPYSQV